jgi:hypothetical protein
MLRDAEKDLTFCRDWPEPVAGLNGWYSRNAASAVALFSPDRAVCEMQRQKMAAAIGKRAAKLVWC